MTEGKTRDTFDNARSVAAAGMVIAGASTIAGTLMDWVTVTPPVLIPVEQAAQAEPFSGLETRSAPFLLIAAGILILSALMLVVRRRPMYAWIGFLSAIVIGGIGFQNYRGLQELFFEQMDGIGTPHAALGLRLVVAGGIVGLIAVAGGLAGTPSEPVTESS